LRAGKSRKSLCAKWLCDVTHEDPDTRALSQAARDNAGRMRNVFDQYSQPENRLTHALATSLATDRSLIRPFLHWAGIVQVPAERHLQITQQQVPGVPVSGEEVGDGRGVPDACIFGPDGWTVLIEAKVQAGASGDQLRRHAATARRNVFAQTHILLFSVDPMPPEAPQKRSGSHAERCPGDFAEGFNAASSPNADDLRTGQSVTGLDSIGFCQNLRDSRHR